MSSQITYQDMLKAELHQRSTLNKGYSLRAFARDLKISPAYLSQIFNKKKSIPFKRATKIVQRMDWPSKKQRLFFNLVNFENTDDTSLKANISKEISEVKNANVYAVLKHDVFSLVSDWYHVAIIELVVIHKKNFSASIAARSLGISLQTAHEAIARLLRCGLLTESNGQLKRGSSSAFELKDIPSEAIRKFHDQMMKKAAKALFHQPTETRYFSGLTMAIDPKQIPEARKMIQESLKEINDKLGHNREASALYQLSVQFFRLDQMKGSYEK